MSPLGGGWDAIPGGHPWMFEIITPPNPATGRPGLIWWPPEPHQHTVDDDGYCEECGDAVGVAA